MNPHKMRRRSPPTSSMGMPNPVYALFIPLLFAVSLPLAVLAGITSTLAFSMLICRVVIVYLDLVLSIIGRFFLRILGASAIHPSPSSSSPSPQNPSSFNNDNVFFKRQYRHHSARRRSSADVVTPLGETGLGLIPSVGPERDFEGVGGWRGDGGDDDDKTWTTINSRLELPDRQFSWSQQQQQQQQYRSLSGGPTTPTPSEGGFLMMKGRTRSPGKQRQSPSSSPNSSRVRAPSLSRFSGESYFPKTTSPTTSSAVTANKSTKRAPP